MKTHALIAAQSLLIAPHAKMGLLASHVGIHYFWLMGNALIAHFGLLMIFTF